MASESIIIQLQQYISLLKDEGIKIDKAFLFGSYANNLENDDSDIDLMLVSKHFDKSDDITYGKIWALTKKINSKIEPYIVGLDRFENDTASPIIYLVKNQGLEIAC